METQLRLFDVYDKDMEDYNTRMDIWKDWKRGCKKMELCRKYHRTYPVVQKVIDTHTGFSDKAWALVEKGVFDLGYNPNTVTRFVWCVKDYVVLSVDVDVDVDDILNIPIEEMREIRKFGPACEKILLYIQNL